MLKHHYGPLRKYYIIYMPFRMATCELMCHHSCMLKIQCLCVDVLQVGGGQKARGDVRVRPLFSGHGVRQGLFTGHFKWAVVAGVVLPSLLCAASCLGHYKQRNRRRLSAVAEAYSCPNRRKSRTRGRHSSDFYYKKGLYFKLKLN